jgi:hypothetical protein
MKDSWKEFYRQIFEAFSNWQPRHEELLNAAYTEQELNEIADVKFVMRKIDDLLEEMHKRSKASNEVLDRLVCAKWALQETTEPVRTEYVTITPRIKLATKLPKKGEPEYEELMREFGVTDPDLLVNDSVRPHWPGVMNYITELTALGKPLPKCIKQETTYPVYSTVVKEKKGLLS